MIDLTIDRETSIGRLRFHQQALSNESATIRHRVGSDRRPTFAIRRKNLQRTDGGNGVFVHDRDRHNLLQRKQLSNGVTARSGSNVDTTKICQINNVALTVGDRLFLDLPASIRLIVANAICHRWCIIQQRLICAGRCIVIKRVGQRSRQPHTQSHTA